MTDTPCMIERAFIATHGDGPEVIAAIDTVRAEGAQITLAPTPKGQEPDKSTLDYARLAQKSAALNLALKG